MNNKLIEYIKKLNGNVLGVGIDDLKVVEALEKNNKITECNLLESISSTDEKKGKEQKVSVKKLRKIFKHKQVDYFIFNHKKIDKYLNTFIKDSIYLTNNKIYFCTKDKENIIKKYTRYNVKIEEVKTKDGYILIIDSKDAKMSKIKELYYDIVDKIEQVSNYISDSLVS